MTHRQFIIALGDTNRVAALTGQKLSTVSNWKIRGVPWRYRPMLATISRRKRIALPEGFLDPEEAAQ
jgi:hypothetical protein